MLSFGGQEDLSEDWGCYENLCTILEAVHRLCEKLWWCHETCPSMEWEVTWVLQSCAISTISSELFYIFGIMYPIIPESNWGAPRLKSTCEVAESFDYTWMPHFIKSFHVFQGGDVCLMKIHLEAHMLEPIQRVPRYELLLRRMSTKAILWPPILIPYITPTLAKLV